jgi:hypothetical protein
VSKYIRLLLIEDNEDDAVLLERTKTNLHI